MAEQKIYVYIIQSRILEKTWSLAGNWLKQTKAYNKADYACTMASNNKVH